MDLLATYPRRLTLFAILVISLLFGLRGPIAYLNMWRADQEVMSNNVPWAATEYRRALFLTPYDPQLLVNVGYAYTRRERHAEAIAAYKQAATLDKQSTEALYLLALELQNAKDLSGAAAAMEEALKRDPGEMRTRVLLAIVETKQGRTGAAIATWKEVARRFPTARPAAEGNIRDLEAKAK